ncbi:MAG TPA: RNA-binding cell elongation regulator Jag/EloR [Bacteroidales bacterium]|nr:RNA-binding cell elongation regulator Jag/EloR [Bacteroidales bacterium]HRW33516.1 RNA-binding cell elongation regulator Jag/EloR [Thermotogota bacterium]
MREYELSGKTVEIAVEEAEKKWDLRTNEYDFEVVDPGSKGFLKIGSRDASIKIIVKIDFFARKVCEYINSILNYSHGINHDLKTKYKIRNGKIYINLFGEELGRIIGKHGKTISALQHIANIYVNRITDVKAIVLLEVGDYKDRRKEIIEKIAVQNAKKAKYQGNRVELDPMFSFERRIVHETIKKMNGVRSYSKGLEPYRFVVIEPRKGFKNHTTQRNDREGR